MTCEHFRWQKNHVTTILNFSTKKTIRFFFVLSFNFYFIFILSLLLEQISHSLFLSHNFLDCDRPFTSRSAIDGSEIVIAKAMPFVLFDGRNNNDRGRRVVVDLYNLALAPGKVTQTE